MTGVKLIRDKHHRIAALGIFIAVTYLAAIVGTLFSPDGWYATLRKPSWTPPGWLFGPVWTALYTTMATAAWLVWQRVGLAHVALKLYAAQLVVNILWSPLFFGLKRPDWAFIDVCILWGLVVLTTGAFWRISKLAGVLFVPYLAWVSFAGVLNFTIMWLWLYP